jgi:protein-tyrosine phosphatase
LKADAPRSTFTKYVVWLNLCKKNETFVIPDPYYGGEQGFENVLDLIEDATDGVIKLILPNIRSKVH